MILVLKVILIRAMAKIGFVALLLLFLKTYGVYLCTKHTNTPTNINIYVYENE